MTHCFSAILRILKIITWYFSTSFDKAKTARCTFLIENIGSWWLLKHSFRVTLSYWVPTIVFTWLPRLTWFNADSISSPSFTWFKLWSLQLKFLFEKVHRVLIIWFFGFLIGGSVDCWGGVDLIFGRRFFSSGVKPTTFGFSFNETWRLHWSVSSILIGM